MISQSAIPAGKYRIVSHVIDGSDNVFVICRGTERRQVAEIPTDVLTKRIEDNVFEVVEGAGYRVPRTYHAGDSELAAINAWRPEGQTIRGGI